MSVEIVREGKKKTLLTAVEAAAIIECHPNTVSAYARDGRLMGQKICKVWYFEELHVRAFKKNYVLPIHGGKRLNTSKSEGKSKTRKKRVKQTDIKAKNFASGKKPSRIVKQKEHPQGKVVRINGKKVLFYDGPSSPDRAWSWAASVGLK